MLSIVGVHLKCEPLGLSNVIGDTVCPYICLNWQTVLLELVCFLCGNMFFYAMMAICENGTRFALYVLPYTTTQFHPYICISLGENHKGVNIVK